MVAGLIEEILNDHIKQKANGVQKFHYFYCKHESDRFTGRISGTAMVIFKCDSAEEKTRSKLPIKAL